MHHALRAGALDADARRSLEDGLDVEHRDDVQQVRAPHGPVFGEDHCLIEPAARPTGPPDPDFPRARGPAGPQWRRDHSGSARSAFDEPVDAPPARWIGSLVLLNLGLMAGWFGPIQVLLAQQADRVAAAEPGGMSKELLLAVVLFVGATISLLANPVWGAFSDRTRSRLGRRVPWVIGGVVIGAVVAAAALGRRQRRADGRSRWSLVQLALNAAWAGGTAAVPDQVPVARRGPDRRDDRDRRHRRRAARHQDRRAHRLDRPGLRRHRGRHARAVGALPPRLARHRAARRPRARADGLEVAAALVLDLTAGAPRLRVGLDDPVHGQPRQLDRAELPLLLPHRRPRLHRRRGDREARRPGADLRRHDRRDHGRRGPLERPRSVGARCS